MFHDQNFLLFKHDLGSRWQSISSDHFLKNMVHKNKPMSLSKKKKCNLNHTPTKHTFLKWSKKFQIQAALENFGKKYKSYHCGCSQSWDCHTLLIRRWKRFNHYIWGTLLNCHPERNLGQNPAKSSDAYNDSSKTEPCTNSGWQNSLKAESLADSYCHI